jgi:hypothetical protein
MGAKTGLGGTSEPPLAFPRTSLKVAHRPASSRRSFAVALAYVWALVLLSSFMTVGEHHVDVHACRLDLRGEHPADMPVLQPSGDLIS